MLDAEAERDREAHNVDVLTSQNAELERENTQLKQNINDLKAVLYQILDQDDNDFFDDNIKLIERQNIRRMLKSKFPLTHEILDIVNKSRRPPQENVS